MFTGLSVLVGTSAYVFWGHLLWPALWMCYLVFCRSWLQIILTIGAVIYGTGYLLPQELPTYTTALFSPSSLGPNTTPFGRGLLYKGTLIVEGYVLPCSIAYQGKNHPPASQSYRIEGRLKRRGPYDFVFKPKPKTKWEPVEKSWSLAELRYQTKEKFRKFLSAHLSDRTVASFLSSLTTGDVEERIFRYEFGRLGLGHLLAISGFHFGILIAFCTFGLSLFLPRMWQMALLFCAINCYFFFVGSSPAVQRSWLMALLYLLGNVLNRPISGLNLLGCALTIELLLNPLSAGNLGFQLSFLSCAGILFFYPIFYRPSMDLLSNFFRGSVSLTFAVNLPLFPLLLYHFHQFPYLSFLYNLFFPFLVGVALFSLLLAVALSPLLLPLSSLLFSWTNWFTAQLLDLVSYPPLPLDYSLFVKEFSPLFLPPILFLLLLAKIHLTKELYCSKILHFCGGRSSVG